MSKASTRYPSSWSAFNTPRDLRNDSVSDTHMTAYAKEWDKEFGANERRFPTRTDTSTTFGDGPRYAFTIKEDEMLSARRDRSRMCGLRRWIFYMVSVLGLLAVIGLIVGLIVGFTVGKDLVNKKNTDGIHANPIPIPPSQVSPSALSIHDPMPGTQIASVAFQDRAAKAMSNQQSFRLYYQQVDGATREMRYDSPSPGWQNATTIFTDAKNYTGMASFTYLNGTERNVRGMNLGEYTKGTDMEAMPQIFVVYVDSNNVLQGRRKTPFDPVWASSSPLAKKGFHADGSSGNVAGRAGLGLTAVYSTDFASGAGARVFYHAQPSDPSKSKGWVQELIWDEKGDSWSLGARIQDVAPTSQLAAVVNGQFLRLFYSTGQRKLQESWTNITDPKGNYTKGISKDDLLPTDESSISALTLARSVILYYNDLRGDVREVNITGIPNSPKQTVDTSSSIIVTGGAPKYPTSIGSVVGTASDSAEQVHVFATDHPGSEAEGMTISVIAHMTRNISQPTWPTTTAFNAQDRLPLGLHSK